MRREMKREKRLLRMLLWPFWGGQRGREGGKGRDSRVIESRGPKGVKETERDGEHYLTFALRQVSRGDDDGIAAKWRNCTGRGCAEAEGKKHDSAVSQPCTATCRARATTALGSLKSTITRVLEMS